MNSRDRQIKILNNRIDQITRKGKSGVAAQVHREVSAVQKYAIKETSKIKAALQNATAKRKTREDTLGKPAGRL